LDRLLPSLAFRLANAFGISGPNALPGVTFFDDHEGPNALATADALIASTSGTVLLGRRLLTDELHQHPFGGGAIAGIVAHEFAHILQYRARYYEDLLTKDKGGTVRCVELHADFMAGWFLGLPSQSDFVTIDSIDAFAESLYRRGDTDFTNPQHHGTYAQRYAAMLKGFFLGHSRPSASLSSIAQLGADFVVGLV
jgi:hypothetical protein